MERLSALSDALIHFLYPEHCLGCGVPDSWICAACLADIPLFDAPRVPSVLPSGRIPHIKRIFAVSAYAERLWNECVRALKYEQLHELVPYLQRIIHRYRTNITPHWPFGMGEGWTIIPIPTNADHIDDRGGDHMESWLSLLRELLPEAADGRGLIQRRTHKQAQASFLTKGAREQAAANSFIARPSLPARVLLLDDVYTTGSTIQAAAEVLIAGGVQEIECLVAAFSQANSTKELR